MASSRKKSTTQKAASSKSKAVKKTSVKPVVPKSVETKSVAPKTIKKKTPPVAAKVVTVPKASLPTFKNQTRVSAQSPTFIEKRAVSPSPNDVLYRIRTFVGWSAFVALAFAGLSMLSEYSTPGLTSDINKANLQASILTADQNAAQAGAQVTQAVPTLAAEKQDVTLVAVGDIMLARLVEKKTRASKDPTYPFVNVKSQLSQADLTFGNLETPFFPGLNTPSGSYTFRADAASVAGLSAAGFDLISLANNHSMNYRVAGLQTTLQALAGANIRPVGAGQNFTEAHTPVYAEIKGRKLAFLAYNDPNIPPRIHGEATDTQAGIASMDIDQMKKDIEVAKQADADIIVVSMHAGIEYKKEPNKFQKEFARAAIDAGASLVIGSHPHVVESVERYGKGIILYSLGNFVFDQTFDQDVLTGLLAKVIFKANGEVVAEFSPTRNEKSLQPRILEGQERLDFLSKMGVPPTL